MEIKTIEDVRNSNLFGSSNYDHIIEESMKALSTNESQFIGRNMDVGDTPISPVSMADDFTPILLSDEVMQKYKRLINFLASKMVYVFFFFFLVE